MPEGPSIVILKEEVQQFTGKKVIAVSGNSKIDLLRLLNQKIIAFKSWGKHFLICFKGFTLRIHFLMFGSYRVNEKKPDRPIRLNFTFKNGEINFYSCSIKLLEGNVNSFYDWSADVMNEEWNHKKAKVKLKNKPAILACDALLEQDIFAGVGNMIKNEVLYRIKIHPESLIEKLPAPKLKKLIDQARIYSFQFLEWKKKYELKKHWLAHTKKLCLRCNYPIIKKYTGIKNRRSFICTNCQVLYN
ncbi:MAG: DNA-formamidopyrimidine glycosylase family protein [Bacteroidia bacterium]